MVDTSVCTKRLRDANTRYTIWAVSSWICAGKRFVMVGFQQREQPCNSRAASLDLQVFTVQLVSITV